MIERDKRFTQKLPGCGIVGLDSHDIGEPLPRELVATFQKVLHPQIELLLNDEQSLGVIACVPLIEAGGISRDAPDAQHRDAKQNHARDP